MTGRRIPETYRNQDWPRKVAKQVNEIQTRIDSGEFDGGGGTQNVNDLISGDNGNSLIVGGDGKLYVPPIIPDSASVQLSWIYIGVSGESNPNPNSFRMNNANPADVTQLYVSEIAYPNRNIANIIEIMSAGDVLYLQQRNDETRYILATLLSLPTENTGFFTLDVEVQDSDQAFQINQFTDFVIYHGGGGDTPTPGPDGGLKDPVFTYDGDFLTRIDYDDGSFKTFAYVGGNLDELVFEPNGGTTVIKNFFYDAQGRLSNIVET